MLIHRISADTLEGLRRLNEEVAARLAIAQTAAFADEAAAEAYLWGVVALLQEQAPITARVLTAAIDARDRSVNEATNADGQAQSEERS